MYSSQGVETEETPADITEDQEPTYMSPPLNFSISIPPVQPNPYAFAAMVPPFPNNPVLQYARYGASLALNVHPRGQITQDGTPAGPSQNSALMYQMFPQFMPHMPAQNVIQPPSKVSTHGVPGINPPRPTEYQLLEERIRAM